MKAALLNAVPEGCCVQCFYAKGKKCDCGCNGEFHGHGINQELRNL